MTQSSTLHHALLRITPIALAAIAAFALACASSAGPVVLTDTPDEVAIEFPMNGSLSDATALAEQACAKHGRMARFGVVKTAATPTTRVAKYRCIAPEPAVAATPPAAEVPAAATDSSAGEQPAVSSAPPEDQPSATSDTSAPASEPTAPAVIP